MTCRHKEINFLLTQGIGAAREQLKTTVDRLDDMGNSKGNDTVTPWCDG